MFSTITKVLAGLTIASAAATTVSVIHDKKSFDPIKNNKQIGKISDDDPEKAPETADDVLNSPDFQ